ncbi:MAG: DHA2 family efflux MFS transporter permease subunit [Mycobacteriales bacterium]|nr:DHA2 family efflux MFS transporter permease subunit [Mycobacteriales bacterium]
MARDVDPFIWRVGVVTVLGSVMSVLDTTIVNVALEPLAGELDATKSGISWVVTAYLLAIAAVTPVTGWAARRLGTRRLYLASLVLFSAGSLLCGLAWSLESLVVARVLQGLGGGLLLPVGQMIVVRAAGREHLGRVMGVLAVPTVLAPVFGPTLGGLLLETVSWRAIFLINLPIGAAAIVAALRILPRDAAATPGSAGYRLDVVGLLLAPTGLALVTFGLSESAADPALLRPAVVGPVVVGLLLVAAFTRHALHAEHPLLELRLFSDGVYSAAALAGLVGSMVSLGGLILMPFYFQDIRGESALATGMLMAPTAVGVVLVLRRAGVWADRWGGGHVALVGTGILAVGTVPFLWLDASSSYPLLLAGMVVRGIGVGLAGMPLTQAAMVGLRPERIPDASAQLNVVQRVGGSLGTALFVVVLQRRLADGEGALAYGDAFAWVLATTVLSAVPVAVLVRRERQRRRAPVPVAPTKAVV